MARQTGHETSSYQGMLNQVHKRGVKVKWNGLDLADDTIVNTDWILS